MDDVVGIALGTLTSQAISWYPILKKRFSGSIGIQKYDDHAGCYTTTAPLPVCIFKKFG